MCHLINDQWDQRHQGDNPCGSLFGVGCFGYVDTFPIKVQRPKDKDLRRATYSGKYKYHCFKVQTAVDHGGRPVYISGPHIGVRADVTLWKSHGPVMGDGDFVLGDKAYVGCSDVIAPYKKSGSRELSQEKKDVNTVLSWFRVTIEHTFADIKKFNILGATFRGKVRCVMVV
jgi:hypothetical protein